MRILMLAPQPFFRARGTPLSVLRRIQALSKLGHAVDLVTYPMGEHVDVSGLTIHRAARVPFLHDVSIGPSLSKILLDVSLLVRAMGLLERGGYELLHTHEEAGIMGAWLSRRYGVPHLYDMHSSLPEQFNNFGRYNWWPVERLFRGLERFALARSDLLITVCPALEAHIRREGYSRPNAMIENVYEVPTDGTAEEAIVALRARLGLEGKLVIVYTGTLEAYQGVDLLLQAVRRVRAALPHSHFLVVGGTSEQVKALRGRAADLGVIEAVSCIPAVPPQQVPLYHGLAAALVTCRTRGTNTPLKLYEYLRAGRPIVATAIHSHEQVLDKSCAELVAPTETAVASGLIRVLKDPLYAASLVQGARSYSEQRYNNEQYMSSLERLLSHLRLAKEVQPQPQLHEVVRAYRVIESAATASSDWLTDPTTASSARR